MALAQRLPLPRAEQPVTALTGSRIRRCTYRRLIALDRGPRPTYDVECLYPDRAVGIPLGDLETARPICNACTATHVFRPDED